MSVPDGIGAVVIAALMLQYLRRFLDTRTRMPDWDHLLKRVWPAAGILIGILAVLNIEQASTVWLWLAIGALIGYTVWRAWEYRPARTIALAFAPFILTTILSKLIKQIAPGFYKASGDYFESGIGFSFIWLITFAIIASRQKKTLEKERIEREAEAEKRRLIEGQNAELERLVAERTAEITSQKEELEHTLTELKATQTQLIQSEKMASLGELTAGIAHEIQNPLNFVNNFSEVSSELLDEMNEEIDKGNLIDAKEIANDLKQNLEKINHHGKRAGDIVKGMLQHSRNGSGVKEPTDINKLADEYLRLAYHGLRAKDKTFNATMKTDFDETIGLINIIPQDIGRVILNLITNAFYAVTPQHPKGGGAIKVSANDEPKALLANINVENYAPTIWLTTKLIIPPLEPVPTDRKGKGVLITVRDNGAGIPPKILDKIFQPFFTTKPTGQGTGLGLSLSYDIVKAHGGELKVETNEGQGSTFTILLPQNQ